MSRKATLSSLLIGAFSKRELELLQSHPRFLEALEQAQEKKEIDHFESLCTLGHELLEEEPRRRTR